MSARERELSHVTLSRIDETFYQAAAAVVVEVLERSGVEVTVVDGSHTVAYDMVGTGEADLCVAFWLPSGHAEAWAALEGRVEPVTAIFDDARFYWAVPDYCDVQIRSISDIADPSIASSFPKEIRGLSLDATITTASQEAVKEYGLSDLGFSVTPGEFAEWEASLVDAIDAQRPVILPLWRPYWFNKRFNLRALADPQLVLRGPNIVTLAAHLGVANRLPERTRQALDRMTITVDDVTDMDYDIKTEHLTPEESARRWLDDHHEQVLTWFTPS